MTGPMTKICSPDSVGSNLGSSASAPVSTFITNANLHTVLITTWLQGTYFI